MSADNYYVIRKHPNGGYGLRMGFASCDYNDDDLMVQPEADSFPTVGAAFRAASQEYTEYGVQVHPECGDDW